MVRQFAVREGLAEVLASPSRAVAQALRFDRHSRGKAPRFIHNPAALPQLRIVNGTMLNLGGGSHVDAS